MGRHRLLLAVTVLGLISAAAAASAKCDEDSDLIGSPWKAGSPYYTQEVAWRAYGMITKVNAYTDAAMDCLVGVKATYGWEAMNARRLGIEKAGNENLPSLDRKLQKGEVFNRLQYKADSCITYFSLQTNQGRNLTVGDINSSGELRTSQGQWADSFLAYFKGYTDVPNTSANSGKVEQLQLVWASKTCKQKSKGGSTKAVQPTDAAAAAAAVQKMKAAYQSGLLSDTASPGDEAFEQGSDISGSTDDVTSYTDGAAAADGTMDAVLLVTPNSPDGVTSDASDEMQVAVQITGQETLPELPDNDLTENSETSDTDSTAALAQAMGAAAAVPQPTTAAAAVPQPTTAAAAVPQPTTAAAAVAPQPTIAAAAAAGSTTVTGSTTASSSASGSANPFFAGPLPLRRPTDDTPTSTTVVNTTTIITTTTSQKKPLNGTMEYTTQTTTTTLSATTAVCKPTTACIDGKCATSSCAINGMGKDVATMLCFGTNLMPNPLLDLTTGNPCANLACKLDKPNCTTTEFGMTGFCTGKVVAMGINAKLHTSGKAFLGYPCIEHRGPMVDLVPVGDYTAGGTYVAKVWKVCDCINGFGLKDGSISFKTPGGGSVTFSGSKFPTIPQFPFLNRPLVNMSLTDVVAQWVAANLADAPVPKVEVNNSVAIQLRKIIPNFTLPSIVLPQMSVPLLKLPSDFELPVFDLPFKNKTIQRVFTVLPDMTSLPTLITPTEPSHIVTVKVPQLHLPQITTDTLNMWADSLGVPIMPTLPPVFNMSFSDVLTQWVVANQFSLPVRKLTLPDVSMDTLQKLIPNFQAPSLMLLNISVPLLKLPEAFPLPVVSIPRDASTISVLDQFLPHLTSLPSFVAPVSGKKILAALPNLSLPNVTIPNIDAIAVAAGAAPPKWFNLPKPNFMLPTPQLPTVPDVNFALPGLTLPSITLTPAKLNLSLPVPNLLQSLHTATNMSVLPELISAWKEQYLSDPLDFDFAGLKNMVASNEHVQPPTPQGIEVSFEVPNVMAQWIAGLVKGAQVPKLEVPGEILTKLQSLLPGLPAQPSLVVMNVSSPYYSTEAISSLSLPTVVVPDDILSKVTSLLPDVTLVPQFLVPKEQTSSLQVNLPVVSLESLAAPSFLQTVSQMMAGLHSKAGGATPQDQVTVNVAPAAAAGTPTAATSTSGGSSNGMMQVPGYTGMSGSPTVTVVQPEPMPTDVQTAMYTQPRVVAVQPMQPTAVNPTAAATPPATTTSPDTTAAQLTDLSSVSVSPDDDSLTVDYGISMEAEPVLIVTDDAAAAASDQTGYNSPTWDDGSGGDEIVTDFYPADSDTGYTDPESGSIGAAMNTKQPEGFREDDEGALLIEGFGPETAFMNPEDFYALDTETQKKFKAMFNL